MSNGNWRPIAAVGIIITLLFVPPIMNGLASYQARQAQERIQAAEHDTDAGPQQGEANCTRIASDGRFTCTFQIDQPEQADPYAEYDLRAQQEMAIWALGVLIATIAGVVVTVVGLIFVVAAYRLNSEQVLIAREANINAKHAFEESERPLFFVSIRRNPKVLDEHSDLLETPAHTAYDEPLEEQTIVAEYIELHNVGTRPAFGVSLKTEVGFLGATDQQVREVTSGMAELGPGDKPTQFVIYRSDKPLLARMESGEILHVSGALVYDDPLGVRRERGFRFVAKTPHGLWRLIEPVIEWERVNDERYNYDKRVQ